MSTPGSHTIQRVDSQPRHRLPRIDKGGLPLTDSEYIERIKARCTVTETGCWECAGFQHRLRGVKNPATKGYVCVSYRNKAWRVHRLMYTLMVGPIPEGVEVLHRCDNPPCCNPMHLRLGTGSDNARDRVAKKRDRNSRKASCPRGHSYDYHYVKGNRRRCTECDRIRQRRPDQLARARAYQKQRRARIRAMRNSSDETTTLTSETK